MQHYDVIVLGGGAAGLFCALTAGRRGRRVVVLEGANRIGKKILMSGGGRCNFTNLHCAPEHYLSANPKFCISALRRYTQHDFIALVDRHGIAWHEKTAGQLFCDVSSKQIVAMLAAECAEAGVRIETGSGVAAVAHGPGFRVTSAHGEFAADSLVIATGGLSIPKMGASDFGYRLARQFGLAVRETRAGLVPFTFSGPLQDMTGRLSGVSVPATATTGRTFAEDILFTHRGMSGPAMLQASSYWHPGEPLTIDLLPGDAAADWLRAAKRAEPRSRLRKTLSARLPRALVLELQNLFWLDRAEVPIGEFPDRELERVGDLLNAWRVQPSGTEGYRTAEVTLGGVDTGELSSRTMETQRVRGLYVIGEVADVTGHLGGFNFQWAWSSGYAAGEAV